VLTHLARNAEAMCRRIDATKVGVLVDQYEGGPVGRQSEIDAGAGRPAQDLVDDVLSWSDRLDDLFETMPADCWRRPVRTVAGNEHPVALLPFRRWREVEVHLADFGLSFTVEDWSSELVDAMLPRLLSELSGRADQRALMAWMLGRGAPPRLERWA
jgi:maleylpyruvate isomerase